MTPSIRSVMRYWCCTETSGTLTPAMRPSSRDHWPAQMTIVSGLDAAAIGDDGPGDAALDRDAGDGDALAR